MPLNPCNITAPSVIYNGPPASGDGSSDGGAPASVVTGVWREASRHVGIEKSTVAIAHILREAVSLRCIVVRKFDLEKNAIETVALADEGDRRGGSSSRTVLSDVQFARLNAWCRRGCAARRSDCAGEVPWDLLTPQGIAGDLVAGPLTDQEGGCGILLLAAGEDVQKPLHLELAQALLEPFSAALENDRRLRLMATMQAAAEADKRSLLTRLGRKELSDSVVGADSGLRAVIERVELVARSDVPVLVLGETGTGKEVMARMIHTQSSRASGPFLRINCGAIPPELIDSQLFGHERGSFTGAAQTRQGWFERANCGTLLLDEVGELPLAAQVRLLRILQDGWLERVGGHDPIHVDVRIVAATHRDLAAMVTEGTFREDLWYRLAVFPISLPPLRDRQEDIPELARHFARRAATRFVLPESMPSSEDIRLLKAYAWPGNIRELASVIDRAAILGDGRGLEVAKALGGATTASTSAGAKKTPSLTTDPTEAATIVSLAEANRRHIETALTATHGQIEGRRGAAAILQVNPHTLRAKMRRLGIDWARFRQAADV